MINPKMYQKPAIGIGIAAIVTALCLAAFAADSAFTEKPAAVDAEQYAGFIENEVFNIQDLAEGAEIQRRRFNRMTPPGFSWVQPMFPSVVPFDAENFDEKFLDELLGEDKNSVAIYPLSLTQDPKTRETLVYNAEGKQIATIPADRVSREWPEDADPARVTLLLDLLPAEDVEPFLYTESRIEESLSQRDITRQVTPGRAIARSLGAGEFGICGIRKTTNGTMLITVTNGLDAAEVYAYTVAHTSSVVVATWTNEYDEVITSTNVIWHPVSPPFNGIQSDWASRATNLVLTGGTGVWEDTNISSNDRVRFYAVANRGDQDGDGLSDGAEILLHRTNQQSLDTDGDGLLDGYDISVQMGDPRYSLWANQGILYSESTGMRLFRGELSAGSSPLDDDTDGDGLPDGWEVQNDLDPLDAEGDNGPEGDPDGDGFDNALERELGAPANNAAWNGNELAYRLMHATPVVVTNTRSIITNLVGMRVTVEDSWDCVTGGNPGRQNEVATLEVRDLLECGYYVDIEIEGSVEDVDDGYDMVYFEAHSNNFYFSSHDGMPDGLKEECVMIDENAEKNNLILANSTVVLRYNTVGYRWHSGAYAEIIHATNTGPYKVVVSGEDVICVGETAQMEASGAAGAPYTWSGNGDISVSTNGEVTGLAPGIATVIATDAGGCRGEKEIIVIIKVDIEKVWSDQYSGIVQNFLPGCSGSAEYGYIMMGARADNKCYAKAEVAITPDTPEIRSKLFFNWAGIDGEAYVLDATNNATLSGNVITLSGGEKRAEDHTFVAGFDQNGDGQFQANEICSVSSAHFKPVTQFEYTTQKDYLQILYWPPGLIFPTAYSFLDSFLNDTVPAGASTVGTTINVNEPTHNVGAVFLSSGYGSIQRHEFSSSSDLAALIYASMEFQNALTADTFWSRHTEVQNYFAANTNETEHVFTWSLPAQITFGVSFDLHSSLGTAALGGTVAVTVRQIDLEVTQIHVQGYVSDLYDWDYAFGSPDSRAARVQAGYNTLGNGGHVYRVHVDIDKVDTAFSYNFR